MGKLREFTWNKDFDIVVGDNGSGKTTVVRYLVKDVDKKNVYVLNASGQKWDFSKKNVTRPMLYTTEWFNKYIIKFLSAHSNCVLILDDADNFHIKKNDYLRSLVINARHANVGIILSIRQVQDIDKLIYKQAKCFIGHQTVEYDIRYLGQFMPGTIPELTREISQYEFLNFCFEDTKPAYRIFKVPQDYAEKWHHYTSSK